MALIGGLVAEAIDSFFRSRPKKVVEEETELKFTFFHGLRPPKSKDICGVIYVFNSSENFMQIGIRYGFQIELANKLSIEEFKQELKKALTKFLKENRRVEADSASTFEITVRGCKHNGTYEINEKLI